ncbi:hypothetical protein L3Y34_007193 [Caenorhabditis briggsae]|uniref:RING-type domain-containing protein n=1 Tax=Caenorhabditis briggsae TaxID=6238 RepID=A0AAE8ZY74_CAEBR|nr:hypothetical protein L3Y34_007193 [Caenorhabditis briggsae]
MAMIPARELFVMSPNVLRNLVLKSIDPKLVPLEWECVEKDPIKNLQNLLNISSPLMDRFQTAEQFFAFIASVVGFPGSHTFFGIPKTEVYCQRSAIYSSLSKREYVYKTDFYYLLQGCIQACPMRRLESELAVSLIAYFLKFKESKVKIFEMAQLVPGMYCNLQHAVAAFNKSFPTATLVKDDRFQGMSIEGAADVFSTVLGTNGEDGGDILNLLKTFDTKIPIKRKPRAYMPVLVWVMWITDTFRKFIESNSKMMTSKSDPVEKTNDSKVIVRLFHSEKHKFVFAHELLHEIKMEGFEVSEFEDELQKESTDVAISLREIFEIVPKEILKHIEFVNLDLFYISTPIPLFNGKYWACPPSGQQQVYVKEEQINKDIQEDETNEQPEIENQDENVSKPTKLDNPKRVKISKKKKKKKVAMISQTPKPTSNESEACPKCYRASLYTRKANEKLKLDKIETKALKKKVTQMEKAEEQKNQEVLEKDARIRALEKIVESQKKELAAKEEESRIKIQNLEKQLEEKDEIIETLESKQSKANDKNELVRDVLFNLLEVRATINAENPISKVTELVNQLMMKTECEEVKNNAQIELAEYQHECNTFITTVDTNLELVRENHNIDLVHLPKLPLFPVLSEGFRKDYKNAMKSDVPNICQSLLTSPETSTETDPNELMDTECLICLDDMESEENTMKCDCCKRRYHDGCIKNWFETKRSCPTCNSGLLDDDEFPTLS